jgi:hypothetical protein
MVRPPASPETVMVQACAPRQLALTVTVSQQLLVQPFKLMASHTVNVQLPAPATTLMDDPVVEPSIVPQPVIDQLLAEPAVALDVYVLVVLAHTGVGPVTPQVGLGLTVTVLVQLPGQRFRGTMPSFKLSINVKLPAAPALTVTETALVGPMMVPLPLIDQLWVEPAGAADV